MKREIKFRAWTRQGEWDDSGENRQFVMIDADSLCLFESDLLKDMLQDIDDEWYVMQYTGLKDKNGKEIYELMEINNEYRIVYNFNEYILQSISNKDIFVKINKDDKLEITGEYSPLPED